MLDRLSKDIYRAGWLKRQAGEGRARGWAKLFVIVKGPMMFMYKSNQHPEPFQRIPLDGLEVQTIEEKVSHLKYVFQVFNPKSPDRMFFLQGSSEKDFELWFGVVEKACRLTKTVKREAEKIRKDQEEAKRRKEEMDAIAQEKEAVEEVSSGDLTTVTYVIETVALSAKKGSIQQPGLLATDIDESERASKLFKQYRATGRMDFSEETNNVAVEFLRCLLLHIPFPLMTYANYDLLIENAREKRWLAMERVKRFRNLIESLPVSNRDCMKRLLEFLCLIHYNSSFNGSTMKDLCVKFGPAILRSERGDEEVAQNTKIVAEIVGFLIRRFPLIYPEEEEERAAGITRGDDEADDGTMAELKQKQLATCLRSKFRFIKSNLHLPAYTLISNEAADVQHKSVKMEIDLAVEFFSREIGNQGLLYLLNQELEELNGRAGRLTTAKQEIEKWADIETELTDTNKDIEGLEEYRTEVLQEITEQLEVKEKKVNEILSGT